MEPSSSTNKNIKQIGLHLRNVHLTLILASTILILSVYDNEKSRLEKAINSLTDIKVAAASLNNGWFQQEIDKLITQSSPKYITPQKRYIRAVNFNSNKINFNKCIQKWLAPPTFFEEFSDAYYIHNNTHLVSLLHEYSAPDCPPSIILNPNISSLGKFKEFWNSFRFLTYVSLLEDINDKALILFYESTDKSSSVTERYYGKIDEDYTPTQNRIYSREYSYHQDMNLSKSWSSITDSTTYQYLLFSTTNEGKLIETYIPLYTEIITLNTIPELGKRVDANWINQEFNNQFPSLVDFTKSIDKLDFDNIDQILQEQLNELEGKINFLGLELRTNTLIAWGGLFLLLIQLYFLLHYETFISESMKVDNEVLLSWIGIYKHPLSRLVTILSICFLPLFVYLVFMQLDYEGISSFMDRVLLLIEMICSISISLRFLYLYVGSWLGFQILSPWRSNQGL